MKLLLRCTQARVSPSDTSGFVVELEVADAEEARAQMLRGPDDGADDWPLAKRYGEVCDRVRALEKEVAELDRDQTQVIRERDDANDRLQSIHRALGGDGEWVGTRDLGAEAEEMAEESVATIEVLREDRERMRDALEFYAGGEDNHRWVVPTEMVRGEWMTPVGRDGGHLARAALAELDPRGAPEGGEA